MPENLPDQSQAPSHVRVIEGDNLTAYARPLYTSLDDPSNHEVPSSDPHDGVAKLILTRTDGTFGCSGTLADDKIHVFTAAHCVADDDGNYILTSGTAAFEGSSEYIVISIDTSNSLAHPDYDGDYIKGNDIAILKLVTSAPVQIPGIPHATSGNAVGTVVDKSGYGISGFFSSGTSSGYPFGTERSGNNLYDAFADTMYVALNLDANVDFIPGAIYQFDSDDGNSSHDAFGFFFGISNTGLGNNEVMSASGDSGGPTFVNGELTGITSYGISLEYNRGPPSSRTSDCTTQLDSSCGEFAGDTRVATYASWIDSVLTPVIDLDSPIITSISTDSSSTTTTITWNTDEPSTSSVDYGTSTSYGSSESDASYVTSHSVELTGLLSSTVYHFSVTSVDASNNSASSADAQFTTTSPPTLVSISISPLNPSITENSQQQFIATGTYSDDSTQELSGVTWSSSSSDIATIDGNGLATAGILAGSTTITASFGDQQDSSTVLEVTIAPVGATAVSVSSITYSGEGGKNKDKHLLITIELIDNLDGPVSGATVSIDLFRDGNYITQGTGITATDGTVTFTLKNAASGSYETEITNVIASGLTWDGTTPSNGQIWGGSTNGNSNGNAK
ncbi:MAG: Ig-like domain-containing protein [Nitrosopumilus sp.]|nr:Ig-like domain-containing protein [Nitrosopumilus sp.]NRA05020.1 Ig-like domain-containing protein [Nitrosopumilus sp.]